VARGGQTGGYKGKFQAEKEKGSRYEKVIKDRHLLTRKKRTVPEASSESTWSDCVWEVGRAEPLSTGRVVAQDRLVKTKDAAWSTTPELTEGGGVCRGGGGGGGGGTLGG